MVGSGIVFRLPKRVKTEDTVPEPEARVHLRQPTAISRNSTPKSYSANDLEAERRLMAVSCRVCFQGIRLEAEGSMADLVLVLATLGDVVEEATLLRRQRFDPLGGDLVQKLVDNL